MTIERVFPCQPLLKIDISTGESLSLPEIIDNLLHSHFRQRADTNEDIEESVGEKLELVRCEERKVTLREAAYMLAVDKMAEITKLRGIFP